MRVWEGGETYTKAMISGGRRVGGVVSDQSRIPLVDDGNCSLGARCLCMCARLDLHNNNMSPIRIDPLFMNDMTSRI